MVPWAAGRSVESRDPRHVFILLNSNSRLLISVQPRCVKRRMPRRKPWP